MTSVIPLTKFWHSQTCIVLNRVLTVSLCPKLHTAPSQLPFLIYLVMHHKTKLEYVSNFLMPCKNRMKNILLHNSIDILAHPKYTTFQIMLFEITGFYRSHTSSSHCCNALLESLNGRNWSTQISKSSAIVHVEIPK